MRRNCNLELCLFPPPYDSGHRHNHPMVEEEDSPKQSYFQNQQQQPLTIFYDGKICATHVTELQAKSILMLASKEVEERVKSASGSSEPCTPTIVQSPHHNYHQHQLLYSPGSGLSMKRSLQHFLQKRKNRVQQASPYHHH